MNQFFKKIFVVLIILATIFGVAEIYTSIKMRSADNSMGSNNTSSPISIKLGVLKTGKALDIQIMPTKILEDSRCPSDVTCIQAGTVRVEAEIISKKDAVSKILTIGEPFYFEDSIVTLLKVNPYPISSADIAIEEYEFTFRVEKSDVVYESSSNDEIKVDLPKPKGVVGKEFSITGKARGYWYFEGSFPYSIVDSSGNVLVESFTTSKSDWMTTEFVPFEIKVKIDKDYIGEARVILRKDNPSGLKEHDASFSFPINIEY